MFSWFSSTTYSAITFPVTLCVYLRIAFILCAKLDKSFSKIISPFYIVAPYMHLDTSASP